MENRCPPAQLSPNLVSVCCAVTLHPLCASCVKEFRSGTIQSMSMSHPLGLCQWGSRRFDLVPSVASTSTCKWTEIPAWKHGWIKRSLSNVSVATSPSIWTIAVQTCPQIVMLKPYRKAFSCQLFPLLCMGLSQHHMSTAGSHTSDVPVPGRSGHKLG